MAKLANNDEFLVNRGSQVYKASFDTLKTDLEEVLAVDPGASTLGELTNVNVTVDNPYGEGISATQLPYKVLTGTMNTDGSNVEYALSDLAEASANFYGGVKVNASAFDSMVNKVGVELIGGVAAVDISSLSVGLTIKGKVDVRLGQDENGAIGSGNFVQPVALNGNVYVYEKYSGGGSGDAVNAYWGLTGPVKEGAIITYTTALNGSGEWVVSSYIDRSDNQGFVKVSGDTMLGDLKFSNDPTVDSYTKIYAGQPTIDVGNATTDGRVVITDHLISLIKNVDSGDDEFIFSASHANGVIVGDNLTTISATTPSIIVGESGVDKKILTLTNDKVNLLDTDTNKSFNASAGALEIKQDTANYFSVDNDNAKVGADKVVLGVADGYAKFGSTVQLPTVETEGQTPSGTDGDANDPGFDHHIDGTGNFLSLIASSNETGVGEEEGADLHQIFQAKSGVIALLEDVTLSSALVLIDGKNFSDTDQGSAPLDPNEISWDGVALNSDSRPGADPGVQTVGDVFINNEGSRVGDASNGKFVYQINASLKALIRNTEDLHTLTDESNATHPDCVLRGDKVVYLGPDDDGKVYLYLPTDNEIDLGYVQADSTLR